MRSIQQDRHADRRGSALLIVMCFAILLMVTSMTLHRMSTQLAFTVGNFRKGAEALAVAESGVSDMLERLSINFSANANRSITNVLASGTYIVSTKTNGATGCIITSVGTVDGKERETVLESLGTWRSGWNTNLFGNWGIAADGIVDVNGQGVLHASGYSGTKIELAPGTVIEGTASSAGQIVNQGTINGETNEFIEPVELPTFNYAYFLALAGGMYLEDGAVVDFKKNSHEYLLNGVGTGIMSGSGDGDVVSPNGSGVICVNGNALIQNDADIRGAIIATGEINMQGGHVTHTGFTGPDGNPLPSLMALGGDVCVASGQTLHGFVYATGNVQLNGGDTVYGGVVALGMFDGRNDWQIFPGPGGTPGGINPADGGEVTRVRIGAWLK
ncbi:hypothetical protein ACFLQU_04755 [Verrucomicrobiota bacterium]